jgi:hypothetical protein
MFFISILMSENHEVKLRYVKKQKNGKKKTTKKPWPLPQGNLLRGIVNKSQFAVSNGKK